MTSTVYPRLPPPPPPQPTGGDGDYGGAANGHVTVPLTRDNITLLQALSQPSRLRRRVAPNFETVSWDDPDHMQYSLNGYRPPRSDEDPGARGATRHDVRPPPPRGTAPGTRGAVGEKASDRSGRGVRYEGEEDDTETHTFPKHHHNGNANNKQVGGGRPYPDSSSSADGQGERDDDDDGQGRRGRRHHPERPSAPLPTHQRSQETTSAESATRLPLPRRSIEEEKEGDAEAVEGERGYGRGAAPQDGPRHTGRLNMRAFEDQFNRGHGQPTHRTGTAVDGTTRREDLPMREIYASRDSDDASYQKRPSSRHQEQQQQYYKQQHDESDEEDEEGDDVYPTEGSRSSRQKEAGSDARRGRQGEANGGRVHDDEHDDEEYAEDTVDGEDDYGRGGEHSDHRQPPPPPRRPLRDTWEKPRSDESDCDAYNGGQGHQRSARQLQQPVYDDGEADGDDGLCGEVVSCDDEPEMSVPTQHRPHRTQQQQQHYSRQHRPVPPPAPPAAPVRGAAYPKAPAPSTTRQETTTTTTRKKTLTRHNPKAFRNKTTHSWISTNTTTTVILPAATVQLVPLSGFAPVVEEVPAGEERWATTPAYLLNAPPVGAPQGAGYYLHRPSQMTVLDDSDEAAAAAEGRGRLAGSLPQLPRRAYDSANNYSGLHDSMPEL